MRKLHKYTNDCILYTDIDLTSQEVRLIKTCKDKANYEQFRRGFSKEFLSMKNLSSQCPTLPKYYQTGSITNSPAIVMEYISGPTLEEYLSSQSLLPQMEPAFLLSPSAISHICRQIYDTICFLYRHNIVYFDLSPSNIIITNNERFDIKLIDFTFCYDRTLSSEENVRSGYKQYEDPARLQTAGRPLPASITRTMLFFIARLFYINEASFARLTPNELSNENSFFRKNFKSIFKNMFEHPDKTEDILLNDSSCQLSVPSIEKELELLTAYYEHFQSILQEKESV